MSDYLDPQNEELLKDFYAEAESQVEVLESNILVLETNPGDTDSIDEIFRAAHTLKGGAATVEMSELAEFTHLLEDALDAVREKRVAVDEDVTNVLLESLDVIKAMLEARSGGRVYQEDVTSLSERLANLAETSAGGDERETLRAGETIVDRTDAALSEYEVLELSDSVAAGASLILVRVDFDEANPMNTVGPIQVYALLKDMARVLRTRPELEELYEDIYRPTVEYWISSDESPQDLRERCSVSDVTTSVSVEILTKESGGSGKASVPSPSVPQDASEGQAGTEKTAAEGAPARGRRRGGSVLRVDSERIDDLLNLVTETVINKATLNQVNSRFTQVVTDLQEVRLKSREQTRSILENLAGAIASLQNGGSSAALRREYQTRLGSVLDRLDAFEGKLKGAVNLFKGTTQNLARISENMQEAVMRIRMVPVAQIFSRFPRLVRDLSRALKKDAELKVEGEETELDKSVIEDLLDPLIHCVRNSLDHGIESPEERAFAGKPRRGHVLLKAWSEGSMILIEIFDDGRGIDVEAIRQKAIDRGLIPEQKLLSDAEAFDLIFDPGFSTASEVTNISGRGVGLDVVRRQIQKLNGTVAVWSEKGKGTRFTIRLPLTLAIIQGLLVRVGIEIYAIPVSSVVETLRLPPSNIKLLDNYEVFDVRDDVLSLIRLDRIFGIEGMPDGAHQFVVIVGSGKKRVGLLVDSLIGEEDVVIKPLKDRFTTSPGIAGATILGDGTVALIIDVSQILEFGARMEQSRRPAVR